MKIPQYLTAWFAKKEWKLHPFQRQMFDLFKRKQSTLLIAPTGGGKTLASFLPSMIDIHEHQLPGLHTLYISPLKALAADIQRNLMLPIAEMELKVRVEMRTGDTNSYQRKRQRTKPPSILLTTPESLMLMLSYTDAPTIFGNLKTVIVDELHSFAPNKRGDLTSLALAQLTHLAPSLVRFGLSATVHHPEILAAWLGPASTPANILIAKAKHKPDVNLLTDGSKIPYSGFMAGYAIEEIYKTIAKNIMTIIFVNTRAQAEFMFRKLWQANQDNYPIAIYHGSLSKEQRLKTEAMTVAGKLKAIIATSALELGIDWGNVDCVIQVGAPKGVSRLLQRIGRSNHQFDKASKAFLVPANCFEALECRSAIDAIAKNQLDGEDFHPGSQDVVIQFIMNCACSAPVNPQVLYEVIRSAFPFQALTEDVFNALFQFVVDGGYTLKHYEQYHRLVKTENQTFELASAKVGRRHRQNIGTIVENARLRVKIVYKRPGGKILGDIEENFAQELAPGDTFLFGGEVLEFIGIRDMYVETRRSKAKESRLPSYQGGTMPLSTYLANDVRAMISNPARWIKLPAKIQEWLNLQNKFSVLPRPGSILVECFPHRKLHYFIVYSFEGRRANHTLGMLITRRMESLKLKPLGFTVTDYGLAISSLREVTPADVPALFDEKILFEELEEWLNQSHLLKRTFRQIAIIAGLTERQMAGQRKTMRQVTFSTDLLYDVLMRHEPEHILLNITRADVRRVLLDLQRLIDMLKRFQNNITTQVLSRPSPLSIPILSAIRTERLQGEAVHELLSYAEIEAEANELMNEVKAIVE
jgi:ATP-dependent Lhr-like helicase